MTIVKRLLLGTAAGLVAVTGAQAADLPVKAKAVEYVKICSLYGAGFYYIPGTDTCIKLGGYSQLDVTFNGQPNGQPPWQSNAGGNYNGVTTYNSAEGFQSRDADKYTTRTRQQFNIDTRTATEYGVVRTYWSSNFDFSTGAGPSSGNLTVDYGFVQFAGFTLGKAISTFQTPWGGTPANNNTSNLVGGGDNSTGVTQIAYTWQFGNGFSAQLGVEDGRVIDRGQLINAGLLLAAGAGGTAATSIFQGNWTNTYGGNMSPDIVGNVKFDSSVVTAQVSAAGHLIDANYYATPAGGTGAETYGHPSDKWGFAVQGGLQLKSLPTGAGDTFSIDVLYSEGATKYLIGGTTGSNFNAYSSGPGVPYNNFAAFPLADAVYGTGGALQLTKAYGGRAGFVHNWSPQWQTGIFGSVSKIDYNGTATALVCGRIAQGVAILGGVNAITGCNPDFTIWQAGIRQAWTPVKNLTFSVEGLYTQLDQSNTGSITVPAAGIVGPFKPAGNYAYKDQNLFSGQFRVRRTW